MTKKPTHSTEQITAFASELNSQSDRGAGIVAAAVVEDALTSAIRSRLVELSNTRWEALFGRMRPLSSFSAKIELGMALGLYDDNLRRLLDMLRDVRNLFAHRMEPVSFNDAKISDLVRNAMPARAPKMTTTRDQFILAFMAALTLLYGENATVIRIKPLDRTLQSVFLNLALAVHAHERRQASQKAKKEAQAPRESGGQKPPPGQK
jgi:hypothetical protein